MDVISADTGWDDEGWRWTITAWSPLQRKRMGSTACWLFYCMVNPDCIELKLGTSFRRAGVPAARVLRPHYSARRLYVYAMFRVKAEVANRVSKIPTIVCGPPAHSVS